MGSSEDIAAIRIRAELARRLAGELKDPHSGFALNEIAKALDAEADNLECNVVQMPEPARRNED
jgi:hypothetical protein